MIPSELPEQIAQIYSMIAEDRRRARNRRRTGTVSEVDYDKGQYRVKLSKQNGKEFLSPWIKTRQLGAGSVKIDVLLKKGEQVDVLSENGDLTDAQIDLSSYSENNERTNKTTPFIMTIGDAVFSLTGDTLTATAGTLKFTGDVEIDGTITCNGVNISDTHTHPGDGLGPGDTGTPS